MVYAALAALALGRGGSGRSNSRPGRVQQEWIDMGWDPTQFEEAGGQQNRSNPYDPRYNLDSLGIYDERGDVRGLPGYHIAPDVQLGHEMAVGRFNDRLAARAGQQAQAALQSGISNLQAYRPGGAAAMLSGLYQGRAQAAFTTAQMRRRDPLNLMFRYDERVRKSAERQAKTASIIGAVGSLVGTVAGAALGGRFGLAPTVNIGSSPSVPGGEGTQVFPGGQGGALVPGAQSLSMTPGAGGGESLGGVPGGGEFMGAPERAALQESLMRVSSPQGGGSGRKSMAPQGGGGGPAPGPGGGPAPGGPAPGPGGPPPQGPPAPGGGPAPVPPQPLYGPAVADVSRDMAIDPGLLVAMVRASSSGPSWIDEAHATLDALNMMDAQFLAAIA